MAPPGVPSNGNKRRRLGEQSGSMMGRSTQEKEELTKWYDPEQNPNERRKIRQGMRENTRMLHGKFSCKSDIC
jgi:hypothetical protein